MDSLSRLQEWYRSHCNEDWEHTYGIRIDTLDNPGWIVVIDLAETELHGVLFPEIRKGDSESDANWITCTSDGEKFQGACGAMNLEEVLSAFLSWAEVHGRGAG